MNKSSVEKESAVCKMFRRARRPSGSAAAEVPSWARQAWEAYDDMTDQQKQRALKHRFAFDPGRVGAGWEYPEIRLDGEEYVCRVSYIGPGICDFMDLVRDLKVGDDVCFTWTSETSYAHWSFSRRGSVIYVVFPHMTEGIYMDYSAFDRAVRG